MRIHLLIGLTLLFSVNCDLLEENFFFHILENVVVPNLNSLDYISKIRFAVTITNAAYDSLAPYLDDSMSVFSVISRRPVNEKTARNKNIAIGFAAYRVISNLLPKAAQDKLNEIFQQVGLNPNDRRVNLSSPIGIGNYAAQNVLKVREFDGMNQYGRLNGKEYNLNPYEDYTNFIPKNTPYDFSFPTNWQPLIEKSDIKGVYTTQTHAYPQYGLTKPVSSIDVDSYSLPPPKISDINSYKQQVDEFLSEYRDLNDYKKMAVEHFNDKIVSLLQPVLFLAKKYNLTQDEVIVVDFITHMALFDAGIVTWKHKINYNSVRPISAIRHIYADKDFVAWGGPGVGIVKNINGKEWLPYSKTNAHAEYPSAISCFCAAQFTVLEKYFKTTEFGYSVVKPAGSSTIEPNITPSMTITLGPYETFDDYVNECGSSRVWGGVHFRDSVEQAKSMCKTIGEDVYDFASKYIGSFGTKY